MTDDGHGLGVYSLTISTSTNTFSSIPQKKCKQNILTRWTAHEVYKRNGVYQTPYINARLAQSQHNKYLASFFFQTFLLSKASFVSKTLKSTKYTITCRCLNLTAKSKQGYRFCCPQQILVISLKTFRTFYLLLCRKLVAVKNEQSLFISQMSFSVCQIHTPSIIITYLLLIA